MLIISGLREMHARVCGTTSSLLNLPLTFTSIDTEEGQIGTTVAVLRHVVPAKGYSSFYCSNAIDWAMCYLSEVLAAPC